MTSTTFTDKATIIQASWLNDVNTGIYTAIGDGTNAPATNAAALANLVGTPSGDGKQLKVDSTNGKGVSWAYPASVVGVGKNHHGTIGVSSTTIGTFTSDQTIVGDGTGARLKLSSPNVSADLAVSGLGGLDIGAKANSTWYYLWVISKADGTANAVWSLQDTNAPTLPAGYTFFALVSAGYVDSGGNLVKAYERGNEVYYSTRQNILTAGTATTTTAIDITAVVPPKALSFAVGCRTFGATTDGSGVVQTAILFEVVSGQTFHACNMTLSGLALTTVMTFTGDTFDCPNIAQTLRYYHSLTTGTSPVGTVDVFKYTMPMNGQ